jgi:pilus assembly protein CpaF
VRTRADVAAHLRERVADDLAAAPSSLGVEHRRELARQRIFHHLDDLGRRAADDAVVALTPDDEQRLAQDVLDVLFGMGRLQALIDDDDVENIDVNGCDRVWVTRADGHKHRTEPVADSDDELVGLIRAAAVRFGLSERRFDASCPELDLRLPDGSRLSALMAVTERPVLSIRRHRHDDLSIDDLVALGTMDEDVASFLAAAVRGRKNIVVAGAMNSGKTTLLRALASAVPARERIVTIEQAFELSLDKHPSRHPDVVALEARPPNLEGVGEITVAQLVRRALRMNADRVIVGEVLGDEVLPMLNAMSQGRSGSMCTIHADSSAGVFRRIASYAVQAPERLAIDAVNQLIAGSVDFVVHLDADVADEPGDHDDGELAAPDGPRAGLSTSGPSDFPAPRRRQRVVSSIREVIDADGLQVVSNELYRPGRDRRAVPCAPVRSETLADLVAAGYRPRGALAAAGGGASWR